MKNQEITAKTKSYSMLSWCVQNKTNPMPVESAKGIYIFDAEGNRWTDLSSMSVYCNIGHQHPKAIAAIKEQADKIVFAGPQFANTSKAECARKIISLLPQNFGKVFFTNGGAEANENAIKFARAYTGKFKIISRYRSYHGASAGAVALTGDPRRWPNEPGVPGILKCLDPYCYRCSFGQKEGQCNLECAKHVEELIMYENPHNIAAILIETITGTNGIIPPPPGYLQKLREICDKHNILLIFDEVMTGWGRTGKYFAFEHYGVVPDIITTAKGITSGYVPLGAVILCNRVAEFFNDKMLYQGLTYYGHTLATGTASTIIDIYKDEGLLNNSLELGAYAKERLVKMMDKHPCLGQIRGQGLFIGIELVKNRATKEMMCPFNGNESPVDEMKKYLYANKCVMMIHWNVMLFCPPLVITREQVDEILDIFDQGFAILDQYVA